MFQDGSGGGPTNSPQTLGTKGGTRLSLASGRDALQAVRHSRARELVQRPIGTASVLGPAAGPHRRAVTPSPRGRAPSQRASDCAQNRSWHSARRKCTLTARQAWCAVQEGSSRSTVAEALRAEFPGLTLRIHPFDSIRFHVLLNSLFKVLFNFPSRYLSAIGLVPVFSLRWSLPPTLGCILKQPDSKGARSRRVQRPNGPDTRFG